jgi:hydroxyacylglutathione hydrolase
MTLPDATRVFPAHGAGSACGKNLSTETQSTIGVQRVENYAVQPMDKHRFVEVVTEGQPAAPGYFAYDAALNKKERELLDETEAPAALGVDDVLARQRDGAVVLDTRDEIEFAQGHLQGSVNVGVEGRYAEYAGSVVDAHTPIVLVTVPGRELEAKVRLGRIGFDNVLGVLDDPYGAFQDHPELVEVASRLSVEQLADRVASLDRVQLIDVRNPGETALGTVPDAEPVPLARLREAVEAGRFDPGVPTVVYCLGGYRSSVGASLLRSLGFADVSDLVGGYQAWATAHATA